MESGEPPASHLGKVIIEMWEAELAALPVRKRKNWKGSMIDRFGVKGVVVYDPQGIEVPGYGHK